MEEHNLSLPELTRMMREVFRIYKKRFDEQEYEEIKISIEQFGLLHAISTQKEEVIQKDMAEFMGKDKSAVLRLIDSLEEKELVRRITDIKDRRKNYLLVTEAGEWLIKHYIRIVDELMVELQGGLTQFELDTFNKVVNHIKNKAENF